MPRNKNNKTGTLGNLADPDNEEQSQGALRDSPEGAMVRIIEAWKSTKEGEPLIAPPDLVEQIKGTSIWEIYEAFEELQFRIFKAETALSGAFHARVGTSTGLVQGLIDKVQEIETKVMEGNKVLEDEVSAVQVKLAASEDLHLRVLAQSVEQKQAADQTTNALQSVVAQVAQRQTSDTEEQIGNVRLRYESSSMEVGRLQERLSVVGDALNRAYALVSTPVENVTTLVFPSTYERAVPDIIVTSQNLFESVSAIRRVVRDLKEVVLAEDDPDLASEADIATELSGMVKNVMQLKEDLEAILKANEDLSGRYLRLGFVIQQINDRLYKPRDWDYALESQTQIPTAHLHDEIGEDVLRVAQKCHDHDRYLLLHARHFRAPWGGEWGMIEGAAAPVNCERTGSRSVARFWVSTQLD